MSGHLKLINPTLDRLCADLDATVPSWQTRNVDHEVIARILALLDEQRQTIEALQIQVAALQVGPPAPPPKPTSPDLRIGVTSTPSRYWR